MAVWSPQSRFRKSLCGVQCSVTDVVKCAEELHVECTAWEPTGVEVLLLFLVYWYIDWVTQRRQGSCYTPSGGQ